MGDLITHCLIGRHKASGPGRCIFDECPLKMQLRLIGISDCRSQATVGHAVYCIQINCRPHTIFLVSLGEKSSAAITGFFNVHAFIGSSRVTIICPKKRTYTLFLQRFPLHFDRRDHRRDLF